MPALNSYRDKYIYYHHSIDTEQIYELYNAHFHDKYEILIVLSGKGVFSAEGRNYSVSAGKVFLTRPGETHFMKMTDEEPYERVVLHFSPQLLDGKPEFLRAPFEDRPVGHKNEYSVSSIGLSANLLASIPDDIGGQLLCAYVQARGVSMLCDLSRISALDSGSDHEVPTPPCQELSACLEYINQNIFGRISLDDVAKAGYLSVSQLCRLFKNKLGTTVHEYVKHKKLIAAKQMLLDGDEPASVAKQCGFGSYTAFYRAYHETFGVSPSGICRKARSASAKGDGE